MASPKTNKGLYEVYVTNWWKENTEYPGGLEPCLTRVRTIKRNVATEEEARAICKKYNSSHKPGRLSRKAEFTRL